MPASKQDIIARLQKDILPLQGFKSPLANSVIPLGLGPLEAAFPTGHFPTGAVHEWITTGAEQAAATQGFIAGLLGALQQQDKVCVWISADRTLFPPALASFGILPQHVIFIDVRNQKDTLWAMEEALQCESLAAVIAECRDIDLTTSRRYQLAVEHSRVTGFLLRQQPWQTNPIASIARWKVHSLPSVLEEGLPGVGFPRWEVELLKVRNGRPGKWIVEFADGRLRIVTPALHDMHTQLQRKAG